MFIEPERFERPFVRIPRNPERDYWRIDWKFLGVWILIIIASLSLWWLLITGAAKMFAHHVNTIPAHMISLR